MSAPKSVIKINKNGVEYTSSVDAANYYLFELSRAALRDAGKFLKKKAQANFYEEFRKITGRAGQSAAIDTKVWSSKNTKYPKLEIGLAVAGRGKALTRWFFFQEIGTSKTPKKSILTNTAKDNIAEIVKIESQYLSGLSGEASRLDKMINENDEGDENE